MRIDDLNRTPLTQTTEKTDQIGQQRSGAAGKDGATGSDRAEVSSIARALSGPDPSRIEQLKLDVQSGKYEVPAGAVASAIVDAHLTE